ncbi:putative sulfiredoxin-1 [Sesbania bispinosa]|nr:putative sulfiredoxin-1 [Sesbania bispinosa]
MEENWDKTEIISGCKLVWSKGNSGGVVMVSEGGCMWSMVKVWKETIELLAMKRRSSGKEAKAGVGSVVPEMVMVSLLQTN